MHSCNPAMDSSVGDILLTVATLVTEGRIPNKLDAKSNKKFYEGPHCVPPTYDENSATNSPCSSDHNCDLSNELCLKFEKLRDQVLHLWRRNIPLCVEIVLACPCKADEFSLGNTESLLDDGFLLEKWCFSFIQLRNCVHQTSPITFTLPQLLNAIRSQLYFSQLTAWLLSDEENNNASTSGVKGGPSSADAQSSSTSSSSSFPNGDQRQSSLSQRKPPTHQNVKYRLSIPGETYDSATFSNIATKHVFPKTKIGRGHTYLHTTFESIPRRNMVTIPDYIGKCSKCAPVEQEQVPIASGNSNRESATTTNNLAGYSCASSSSSSSRPAENLLPQQREVECDRFDAALDFAASSSSSSCGASTGMVDDRMHTCCTVKGKHRCDDFENCMDEGASSSGVATGTTNCSRDEVDDVLLWSRNREPAIVTSPTQSTYSTDERNNSGWHMELVENLTPTPFAPRTSPPNSQSYVPCVQTDQQTQSITSVISNHQDQHEKQSSPPPPAPLSSPQAICDILKMKRSAAVRRLTFDTPLSITSSLRQCEIQHDNTPYLTAYQSDTFATCDDHSLLVMRDTDIPTPMEQAQFRKELDHAANMVFNSKTGLPLTSSPAPVRRGKCCFDFDSSINSVSSIKGALRSANSPTDDDNECGENVLLSPCSPDQVSPKVVDKVERRPTNKVVRKRRKMHPGHLLGSFEESVLKGRLEPVSTVHGFTAELGASGSFVPKHKHFPVTVFFYTLGDSDKLPSPYLGHINLGRKGYNVPKLGAVQVTLFNPLGTVVKMFVIYYDLSDMPPNSQTFIRQRNLYMPINCTEPYAEWSAKWLRYLIHLRFLSSKSGKIYLHSDIRMIIFCQSDADTATAYDNEVSYEPRSVTHLPANPRYSPRSK